MKRFPKILYWKWDDKTPEYLDYGLNDCISRFDFDLLYVSFHHLALPFGDEYLLSLIRRTIDTLRKHGRKLLLDIDARNELEAFLKIYPDDEGLSLRFWEYVLDENGTVQFRKDNVTAGRTGRGKSPEPPAGIAGVWLMEKADGNEYIPGTLKKLDSNTITIESTDVSSLYTIEAGKTAAGKSIVIAPLFKHGIPDLFSENLYPFYSSLFDIVAGLPIAGATTDEWGWDLALMNDDGLFYVEAFPYSAGFSRKYYERTDRDLNDDLIHIAYHPAGDISQTVFTTNNYVSTLRKCMEENNHWFYAENKRRFGKDAFVGVHQTFWGDYSDFSVDIVHNGICWWETPWDFPQTDEFVAMPIRTALAHKWGGPVFYNMWYSGNTQQPDTYWRETWTNARFGGRTHYLGYECPNEPGVYRLKHPNALEGVDEMERKITEIDALQRSQPDCRVAVVFGMEAVSCFGVNGAKIVRGQGVLTGAVKFCLALFEACLCDFIPSSEIANGRLILDGKNAVYGSQVYDAVVYIEPEYIDRVVLEKLEGFCKWGGLFMLYGQCEYFNDGTLVGEGFNRLASAATFYDANRPSPIEILKLLDKYKVPRNKFANGCVYQDGSLLFTANAVKPTGNILEVDVIHKGRIIKFTGEDYFYVEATNES